MAPKRRRVTTYSKSYLAKRARTAGFKRSGVVPGYTRRSGYYGRYARTSGELKFHDVDLDDAVVAATGGITASVNLIPQGVTEKTRVGRKCVIKSMMMRYEWFLPGQTGSGNTAEVCRMIIFLDKQANGATASIATNGVLESADFQSFNDLANSGRFRILCDRVISLNSSAGGGNGTTEDYGIVKKSGSFYKKMNIPLEFSATTGAITEIRSNNIGVILICEGGLAGFSSKIRLRFSDG